MKLLYRILFSTLAFLSFPTVASAAPVSLDPQLSDLTIVFANVTSVIATFAGFALLFVIIRGGIAYITAQGDPKAVTAARNTLTWGVIGFIVILAAYLIISTIVGFVAVPGLGNFCLPNSTTACP